MVWVVCSPYVLHHVPPKNTDKATAVFLGRDDVLWVGTDGEDAEEALRREAGRFLPQCAPFLVLTVDKREEWCDVLRCITLDDLPSPVEKLAELAKESST